MKQVKEWVQAHKLILALVSLALMVLVIYITSPSKTNMPVSTEAIILKQQAEAAKAEADAARERREGLEKDLEDTRDAVLSSRNAVNTSRKKVKELRNDYDKIRTSNTAVSNANLDKRERDLRTDLETLYPQK